jgi:DNA-binding transcriptional regulator PaaX
MDHMLRGKIKTRDVLKVVAVGGLVVSVGVCPGIPMALAALVKAWDGVNKSNLGRIITRLEKQEMISFNDMGGKTSITITEKGKRRLLKYDFESIELKRKKRDGSWRLIIFDIPEDQKRNRNAFVKKLREIECVRLQDSVYVSIYPCLNEIDFLCHYLNISDFVTVLTVNKIERGEKLFFQSESDFN